MSIDFETLSGFLRQQINAARNAKGVTTTNETGEQFAIRTSRCNGIITANEAVLNAISSGNLDYTEPQPELTPFDLVRSLTDDGKNPEALATSSLTIQTLGRAVEEYTDKHVVAAQEVQRVRATMSAISSVLNLAGLKSPVAVVPEGAALDEALPFEDRDHEWWTERVTYAVGDELDKQEELGFTVMHDDEHHSPEMLLQFASKYRLTGNYVKFAALAVAAARLEMYRKDKEATK